MGDAGERSEAPGQRSEAAGLRSEAAGQRGEAAGPPRRCPCGFFWGSSKTRNLCSKCFADVQKKQPGDDGPSPALQSSSQSAASISESGSSSSQSQSASTPPEQKDAIQETDTAQGTLVTPTKRLPDADWSWECEATPEKRGRPEEEDVVVSPSGKQKNRRRCFQCQTKLELVQQELGSCRCGRVFCMRHRLPEQHGCRFDHLGRGRDDAVLKMVKLERKVGRACQRIGEECS